MNIKRLSDLLQYLSVGELTALGKKYGLQTNIPAPLLKKPALIHALVTYLETGQKIVFKNVIPAASRATQKNIVLAPQARILFDSHKNDLKTRLFMKKLVGNHFHFTAYGHDWIKQRWTEGNPPTYQEFADFWQKEYEYRTRHKNTPLKEEWAYLNFLRDYKQTHPHADKAETLHAWEITRKEKVREVLSMLQGEMK